MKKLTNADNMTTTAFERCPELGI